MRFLVLVFLFCSFFCLAQQQPIGSWKEYLPYHSAVDLTSSDKTIFCATPFSLFSVDINTKEVERYSKISGLSETGISTIKYDPIAKKLFVAYTNSNIDILSTASTVNIPDLKRENIAGDKSIYHIYPQNDLCYLSTGIGIVVLNTLQNEIKESWHIGNNGSFVKTNMFTRDNAFYYAATQEGLKRAAVNSNPADFNNWQHLSGSNGLAKTAAKAVVNFSSTIITLQNDSLFALSGNNWNLFFANGWPILSVNVSENKLSVCQRNSTGDSKVLFLNTNGTPEQAIQKPGIISLPRNAIRLNNNYWIADEFGGLSFWQGSNFESFKLNSPEDVSSGELIVRNGVFYAAAGSVNNAWNYQYNRAGIYKFQDATWTNYNGFHFPKLDTVLDLISIAIDPRDETIWGGSYGGGLLHIRPNNSFDIYKQTSPLGQSIGDPGSYRVSGLAFDNQNNLWISNYGATKYLHVLKADGSWASYSSPFFLSENAVSQILIDDDGKKWIVSPKGNGVLVWDDKQTLNNTTNDSWRLLKSGTGNGNLPSDYVNCLAKDRNGNIWVGTMNGVAVFECPSQIFTNSCEAIWPVTESGGFANYLLKGEEIKSIAMDGDNRKWIATRNGVWLVNANGDKVLSHFTEDNSSLLSSDVNKIAIDAKTGEVYFGTAKGICSYKSTATEPQSKFDVLIYPNPVPPNYGGLIAIKGLIENSLVKITELNGRLVYQTKSVGGQATWNGKDYRGNKISSGIYLVLTTDENKQEKAAGKIVFISK